MDHQRRTVEVLELLIIRHCATCFHHYVTLVTPPLKTKWCHYPHCVDKTRWNDSQGLPSWDRIWPFILKLQVQGTFCCTAPHHHNQKALWFLGFWTQSHCHCGCPTCWPLSNRSAGLSSDIFPNCICDENRAREFPLAQHHHIRLGGSRGSWV
jgi:hypothetical protein